MDGNDATSMHHGTQAGEAGVERSSLLFTWLMLALMLALLVLSGIATYLGYRHNVTDFHFLKLYHYQLDKLAGDRMADVVFVGDSSLGNAMDAAYFRERTGLSAYNLALTGAFGYLGSHNMIRRVLAVGRPRLVVVMHTVDMMSRQETFLADFLTAPDPEARLLEMPLKELARAYLTYESLGRVWSGVLSSLRGVEDQTVIIDDYVKQGERGARRITTGIGTAVRKLPETALRGETAENLRRISSLCEAEGLRCVYAHGPLVAPLCKEFAPFIGRVNQEVRAMGLTLVADTPYCVPVEQIGDEDDHVAPAFKQATTRHYLESLHPFLH